MNNAALINALRPLAVVMDTFKEDRLEALSQRYGSAEEQAHKEIFQGRGGCQLLTLGHAMAAEKAIRTGAGLVEALTPLAYIADQFDENNLDDEARKFWGTEEQHENDSDPATIELVQSQGGAGLVTLADALAARTVLAQYQLGVCAAA
jgi:hypothetical protein